MSQGTKTEREIELEQELETTKAILDFFKVLIYEISTLLKKKCPKLFIDD